jgi:hypothetical protein
MAARPRKRHLSPKARRALELLPSNPLGDTEALMVAHGFRHETLAGLVLAGLANGRDRDDESGRRDGQG